MRFSGILEQGWYFYDDNWKKEMDTMLLQQVLMVERESGAKAGTGVKSPHALLIAAAEINKKFKSKLKLGDIEERLEVLLGRFNLYNHVMSMPQTYWDREGNRIIATDDVWARIFAGNVLTRAYYREGEPEYYRMCSAFGVDNLKLEPSREIIDIPSDSSTLDLNSPASCEEVTSPVLIPPSQVVRKLFQEDSYPQGRRK